jgi:hypothetical protein
LEKRERAGGMGKMPFFFLPSPPIQNRGGLGRPRPTAATAPRGRRRPGERGKWRGNRGDLNRVLTLGRDRLWRRLRGVGRLWWLVVVVLGGLGGREVRLGWCEARWGAAQGLL